MEPNKFEKYIRDKMLGREIRPSENAWKKVSARLEATPRKSRNVRRYAFAASFIGIVIVSALFFRSGNNESVGDGPIVDRERQESNAVESDPRSEPENKFQGTFDGKEDNALAVEKTSTRPDDGTEGEIAPEPLKTVNKETVDITLGEIASEEVKIDRLLGDSEESIDMKIDEVLAKVDLLEENQGKVTDTEIDSLLRKAQQELMSEKIHGHGKSVDAMALLTEVEAELDESFRDQIFEKLRSGFHKVRTAVADRNN